LSLVARGSEVERTGSRITINHVGFMAVQAFWGLRYASRVFAALRAGGFLFNAAFDDGDFVWGFFCHRVHRVHRDFGQGGVLDKARLKSKLYRGLCLRPRG
jgi:hypothetical protein